MTSFCILHVPLIGSRTQCHFWCFDSLTLVLSFGFLRQNFGKVIETYKCSCYSVRWGHGSTWMCKTLHAIYKNLVFVPHAPLDPLHHFIPFVAVMSEVMGHHNSSPIHALHVRGGGDTSTLCTHHLRGGGKISTLHAVIELFGLRGQ